MPKQKQFTVTFAIDVSDVDPTQAALHAWKLMSQAPLLPVAKVRNGHRKSSRIDLALHRHAFERMVGEMDFDSDR